MPFRLPCAMSEVISIHALREEGDFLIVGDVNIQFPISIHALREEGDLARWVLICGCSKISIHALREEGDERLCSQCRTACSISIHALREEGDDPVYVPSLRKRYFYPRPPRGGRLRKR